MSQDKATTWAKNAVDLVMQLYGQGAEPEFVAGALATAALVGAELYVSKKSLSKEQKAERKADLNINIDAGFERAKMLMRSMRESK